MLWGFKAHGLHQVQLFMFEAENCQSQLWFQTGTQFSERQLIVAGDLTQHCIMMSYVIYFCRWGWGGSDSALDQNVISQMWD
jgi:hypothetical protein